MYKKYLPVILLFFGLSQYINAYALSSIEDFRYEDWFTFKHKKSYVKDPWIWVYTAEFAERFRLPAEWIDPSLKGALAVSFRVTSIGRVMCGLGGQSDKCWLPRNCQMDIYYDNQISLPWTREDIESDFLMNGISSKEFIYRENPYEKYSRKPHIHRHVGIENGLVINGKYSNGPAHVAYYDKELVTGVGLIGYIGHGVCPTTVGSASVIFYDQVAKERSTSSEANKNAKAILEINMPASFISRANQIYESESKINKEFVDKLLFKTK